MSPHGRVEVLTCVYTRESILLGFFGDPGRPSVADVFVGCLGRGTEDSERLRARYGPLFSDLLSTDKYCCSERFKPRSAI